MNSQSPIYPMRTPDRRWGYASNGNWLLQPRYKYCHPFYNGLAIVEQADGEIFLVNSELEIVEIRRYFGFSPGSEIVNIARPGSITLKNVFVLSVIENGQSKLYLTIDRDKHTLTPASKLGRDFSLNLLANDDLIAIQVGGEAGSLSNWSLFDYQGQHLYEVSSSTLYPSTDSYWVRRRFENSERSDFFHLGCCWYISPSTGEKRSREFTYAAPFSSGIGLAMDQQTEELGVPFFYFVDANFSPIEHLRFDFATSAFHGRILGERNSQLAIWDLYGNVVKDIPNVYVEYLGFNKLGHSILNKNLEDFDLELIDVQGEIRLDNLTLISLNDGDFPFYDAEVNGEECLLDHNLSVIPSPE
jgi:hypothetical protein